MAGRRLDTSSGRHLTLEERVNIAEGEDELSDSDDLDMYPQRQRNGKDAGVSFDEYISSLGTDRGAVEISSDDADGLSSDGGKRVAWSEDEDSDAAYKQFKKRKTVQRQKTAAEKARVQKKMNKDSMVGKRAKSMLDKKKGKERHYADETDEETALMETTLPDYLQQRRSSWDANREKLGELGLHIPPDYADVDFSEDEQLEHLTERPGVSENMQPKNAYKDVELPLSHGVIPAPIAQFLRQPYQVEGVEFMHKLFVYQEGGILGDDMGLGKTIQVIAFLTTAFGKTGDERDNRRMRKMRRIGDDRWYPRALLIVPGSLMANWKNELDKWGWWHTFICHGGKKNREEALDAAKSGRLEIMITTYDTYRRYPSEINSIRWDCVIADECHKIKEKSSEITKQMTDINALCRIGLTGTAIQNKYEELWTLLNWTNPGKFGPISSWKALVAVPLKLGQSHDATYAQLARSRSTASKLVNNLLPPYFLRRQKAIIADQLPKKSDRVVFCPLTETQTESYNNFCDSEILRYIRESSEPCPCQSGKKQGWCCYTEVDGTKWQHFVFPALMMFQKMANHLALLLPTGDAGEKHERELEKLRMAIPDQWKELYEQRDSINTFSNQDFCGKWRILKKLLKLWHANGDKVLVFSYSVRLLKMLDMLFKTTTSYNVSRLDGSTPLPDRQTIVDDYNSNPSQFVFLISTKAGGLGLNITSANRVVIVDPNWNPSYDLQAQDRAYRIGQTRDVEVFRLISAGTIEEIVYARQVYKQQQANIGYNASLERRYFKGVQDQKELKGEIFGLANLFAPASENLKLRDIFNKTNVAESRAGVEIAGLDLEAAPDEAEGAGDAGRLYEEKEDAALSQLAQDIIDEPAARRRKAQEGAKGRDPIMAILGAAGVSYTHENAEVIGTSKVETRISSRAQKAGGGGDLEFDRERAFLSQSQSQKPVDPASDADEADEGEEVDAGKVRYRYHPSSPIRKRQFCSMAREFGYEDVSEFALVVEGWTQEERRRCLERFYEGRRRGLMK